nr:hypothetical protein [Dyadobacter fermentans]
MITGQCPAGSNPFPEHRNVTMRFKGFLLNIPSLWVDGMALFPFILSRRKTPSRYFLNHERIHLKQQLELGLVIFYVWYFVEYLIRLAQYRKHYLAYLHISFEKEAYTHERDLGYLRKRRFCAWWKYL